MLQYKIDSDVRLDGRPCYVQEVRELPEETAHDEAPQQTAGIRHDNIMISLRHGRQTAALMSIISALGGHAARGSPRSPQSFG